MLSELWYYVNQRQGAGASPLHGLLDNNGGEGTPTLWQDDSDGYRLASVVQRYSLADPKVWAYLRGYDGGTGTKTSTPPDTQTH